MKALLVAIGLIALLTACGTVPRNSEPVEHVQLGKPVSIAPPPREPDRWPLPPPPVLAGGGPIGPYSPPPPPVIKPIPSDKWPHVPYVEIRAYLYNLKGNEGTPIVDEKGRLDRSVFNHRGVVLSQKQKELFFKALYQPSTSFGVAHCYRPRHAFVFYDAGHKAVAQFEVCFSCNQYASWPRGLPGWIDLPALSQLVQDIGLPIFASDKEYESLKRRPKGGMRWIE